MGTEAYLDAVLKAVKLMIGVSCLCPPRYRVFRCSFVEAIVDMVVCRVVGDDGRGRR